jgi:hypothetical protein
MLARLSSSCSNRAPTDNRSLPLGWTPCVLTIWSNGRSTGSGRARSSAAPAVMHASGTSDRRPRIPGQFRRLLSAAPRSGAWREKSAEPGARLAGPPSVGLRRVLRARAHSAALDLGGGRVSVCRRQVGHPHGGCLRGAHLRADSGDAPAVKLRYRIPAGLRPPGLDRPAENVAVKLSRLGYVRPAQVRPAWRAVRPWSFTCSRRLPRCPTSCAMEPMLGQARIISDHPKE